MVVSRRAVFVEGCWGAPVSGGARKEGEGLGGLAGAQIVANCDDRGADAVFVHVCGGKREGRSTGSGSSASEEPHLGAKVCPIRICNWVPGLPGAQRMQGGGPTQAPGAAAAEPTGGCGSCGPAALQQQPEQRLWSTTSIPLCSPPN